MSHTDDRDALYPPGSLTGTRRPGLTGSSYDDLPKMAAWCRDNPAIGHVDRARAFTHDPGPQVGGLMAAAEPREDVGRLVDRRSVAEDVMHRTIGGLDLLLGPAVGAAVRSAYVDVEATARAVEGWQIRRGDQSEGTIAHLREIIDSRDRDLDRARNLAACLEEECARLSDPWIGTYLQLLEAEVTDDRRDELVRSANAQAAVAKHTAASTSAPPPLPDPGLPIVDDASLPEHAIQFLRPDGSALAVGRLEAVFGPLDTATQIAVGATAVDLPGDDAAHPLDDLADELAGDVTTSTPTGHTWPDGTEWRTSEDVPGAWLLLSTPQPDDAVVVAPPHVEPEVGARRVDVGGLWGPHGDPPEAPRPIPAGPIDPPRPPHHDPVA